MAHNLTSSEQTWHLLRRSHGTKPLVVSAKMTEIFATATASHLTSSGQKWQRSKHKPNPQKPNKTQASGECSPSSPLTMTSAYLHRTQLRGALTPPQNQTPAHPTAHQPTKPQETPQHQNLREGLTATSPLSDSLMASAQLHLQGVTLISGHFR